MRVQLPFVRRLCEAMRLPILEIKGYEADDVIGTMAVKAGKHNLEVLIVSNDKDMMQLVGKNVRTLRTGSGGLKGDIIVDEKKVEELLGVPPEKVVDYMALLGDTIDNIPGAKGIGEKGAAELIKKYGSVENALDHADEVPNKRYREALQQQREQVLMSKQLAEIAKDAPIEVNLGNWNCIRPTALRSRNFIVNWLQLAVKRSGHGCDGVLRARGIRTGHKGGLCAVCRRLGVPRISGQSSRKTAIGGVAESRDGGA